MSTKEQFVDIVEGDNKYDLVAQIFDWDHPLGERRLFSLTLRNTSTGEKVKIQTLITGIHALGFSGVEFKIHGAMAGDRKGWNESAWLEMCPWLRRFLRFEARYNTRTRKGNIK